MAETDYAVIGGGLVGMAIAYGLQRRGRRVTVFDEGDVAYRASRGNFGLVWVQGKGAGMPDYARWTRLSAGLWPEFADELQRETGVDMELTQPGGLDVCLTESELAETSARLQGLSEALGEDYPFETLDHARLRRLVPEIGPRVCGATYFPEDGHANPLFLLRALVGAFRRAGGRIENGGTVDTIVPREGGFRLATGHTWDAGKVVLCAGLGNARLGPMVGLDAPVKPNRGQVLICERVKPFLNYPTVQIRQIGTGGVQIGDSKEDVGFDDATAPRVIAAIARRATRIFPLLRQVRVVRTWGALRIMSPDGHPVYDRSVEHPGAHLVTCHSGVTLAAVHALVLADWIAHAEPGISYLETFSAKRFQLSPTA
jgi:glycine/D-amino acid oxidase-like deaminating enzyme